MIPKKYAWLLSKRKFNPYGYMHLKCIEPVKRKHGGLKPEWQVHRFEIKNGISWHQAMLRDLAKPNPWFEQMKKALQTLNRQWFNLKDTDAL